jgi:hypothetical protein
MIAPGAAISTGGPIIQLVEHLLGDRAVLAVVPPHARGQAHRGFNILFSQFTREVLDAVGQPGAAEEAALVEGPLPDALALAEGGDATRLAASGS